MCQEKKLCDFNLMDHFQVKNLLLTLDTDETMPDPFQAKSFWTIKQV